MPDRSEEAIRTARAGRCVECGRCVAACPMAEMYGNFSIDMSPRGIVKKALLGDAILTDECLWYCTECNAGTDVCPQGVSCRDLVRGLRALALRGNLVSRTRTCPACRGIFVPVPVTEFVFDRLRAEPPNLFRLLELCPACRREAYMARNA